MTLIYCSIVFLLFLAFVYLWIGRKEAGPTAVTERSGQSAKFPTPKGYAFHVGHTWVRSEGGENTCVGLDSFAANLIGNIEHIDVLGENRWVRQGQRLMTVKANQVSVDLMSPVEGVITSINKRVVDDPTLLIRHSFEEGWVAKITSPEFPINRKNLIQGVMAAPWMQDSVIRLSTMLASSDMQSTPERGMPTYGVLARVPPELRSQLVKEFFRN